MGSPSLTKRLLEDLRRGQEIVTDALDSQGVVPVIYQPRSQTDSTPWVHRGEHDVETRHSASCCYSRLPDVEPGTPIQHVQSGRHGTYLGPDPSVPAQPGYVWVTFSGGRLTSVISRNVIRRRG